MNPPRIAPNAESPFAASDLIVEQVGGCPVAHCRLPAPDDVVIQWQTSIGDDWEWNMMGELDHSNLNDKKKKKKNLDHSNLNDKKKNKNLDHSNLKDKNNNRPRGLIS